MKVLSYIREHLLQIGFAIVCGLLVVSLLQSIWLLGKYQQMREIASEALSIAEEAQDIAEYFLTKNVELLDTLESMQSVLEPDIVEDSEPFEEKQTIITVTVTAYCPCVKCCGIWSEQHPDRIGTGYQQRTSSGTIPTDGRTIATDPDVIPEGAEVIINGHTYIAEDTGSGVKGNHIDIFCDTHEEAVKWGMQTLEVIVLENKAS